MIKSVLTNKIETYVSSKELNVSSIIYITKNVQQLNFEAEYTIACKALALKECVLQHAYSLHMRVHLFLALFKHS